MISTPRLAATLAVALTLAACGDQGGAARAPGDWRAALQTGDGVAAEMALRAELDRGTKADALAPYLGEAALAQGDLREANRWLGTDAFAPKAAAHGFRMLGRLRMREGDLPAAGQAFDRALQTAPRDAELWADIARLRWKGGEQVQSIAASRHARALDPRNASVIVLHAQHARESQGNASALAILEAGLEMVPDNPDLIAEYAATLGDLGRAGGMLSAARRLAQASPGDWRALYLQAVLAARAGRGDLARSLLQRVDKGDAGGPASTVLQAVLDLDTGNPASAAQALDELLAAQPDNLRAQSLMARALAAAGEDRELVARFADRANSHYIAMLVGRAYERLGERERAATFLDRALATGRKPQLVVLPPTAPLAASALRGAVDGPSAVALVRGFIAAGRPGEARRVAEDWLNRSPGSSDAMGLAGDAALTAGDPRAALRFYRRAAAVRRPWPLTKRMVVALDRLGDVRAARELIDAQRARDPGNAEAADLAALFRGN
jgi:tetratricopeptide (TPR) repeat protein